MAQLAWLTRLARALTIGLAVAVGAGQAADAQGCPPGLAKKSPACVPPGQAKKIERYDRDRVRDDVLYGDYVLIRDYDRYRLPPLGPGERYYRMGDRVLRVDEDSKRILDFVGMAATFLN